MRFNGKNIDVETEVLSGHCYLNNPNYQTVQGNSQKGTDWLHQGIVDAIKYRLRSSPDFEAILKFGDFPLHVKKDGKYFLNGKMFGLEVSCNILARIVYAYSVDTKDLFKVYFKCVNIPENIRYALENRVPYHFFEEWKQQDVRLNVQQISSNTYALEISDSVWGEISSKDLNTFINSYRFNKRRGNWHSMSPKKLYSRLMGREPSEGELKLMIAFLKQNRTRDIVEQRAKELVSDMVAKFPNRLFYKRFEVGDTFTTKKGRLETWSARNNEFIFVKGKLYDWKIQKAQETTSKEDRQSVNVYIYNSRFEPVYDENGDMVYDENEKAVYEEKFSWKGPICIDNMTAGGGNSIGDQMIARALTLMNDTMAVKLVGTIKSYINRKDMSEHRLSFDNLEELIWLA